MRIPFLLSLLLFMSIQSSCLKDKPESLPDRLVWNPDLAVPVGTDIYGLNAESGFDTTLFELDPETDLPLWVGEVQVVMEGSITFDISILNTHIDSVNRVLFRLGISNEFPNEALVQAYFLDAASITLDSMFSDGPVDLPPGIPIGEGETSEASLVRKDAIFDAERIVPLENATEILFRAILLIEDIEEIDTTLIPYYPNYLIEVEIGLMTDLTIEL
jgi:hypothetical protein